MNPVFIYPQKMQSERGNILFLILLAVALFAALSYAVTNSVRGGGKGISAESASAAAAAISQYVVLLRNEVQRLRLNGCAPENIDWRDDFYKRYNGSAVYVGGTSSGPVSPKSGCALFQAYGGAITPQSFEQYKDNAYETYQLANNTNTTKAGHAAIRWVNRQNEGTTANDIAILFIGLDPLVCSYLLNPSSPPSVPSDGYNVSVNANSAAFSPYTASADIVNNSANMYGDFFATTLSLTTGVDYCQSGAILLAQ